MTRSGGRLRGKLLQRSATVFAGAAERLAGPFFSSLISLVVIRRTSTEAWGELVVVMVVVQLAAHLVGWGNKEFLLREFSGSPARITQSWQTSLISRLALFALLLPALFWVPAPRRLLLLGAGWCLGLVGAQSFEALVLFRKDFVFALAAECAGSLLVLGLAAQHAAPPTLEQLVAWLALAAWVKCGMLLLRHRRSALARRAGGLDPGYFRRALPFFLLGLSGLLQSRADLYAATWLLSPEQLGRYQVLITMFLLLQSGSAFVLAPYVRVLYRMSHRTLERLAARLLGVGIAVAALGLITIHFVLERLYLIPAGPGVLLLGAAMVLPGFYYLPSIYELLKLRRQATVVRVNVLGALVNLGVSLALLPILGVPGALIGAATAQGSILVLYVVLAGSSSRHETALSRLP